MMEGSTESLREMAPQWSLAGDEMLLNLLENTHKKIISKCEDINSKFLQMSSMLDDAAIDLHNVNNRLLGLSNGQFIESRVYDDDTDVTTDTPTEQPPLPSEQVDDITALKTSISMLERLHETAEIIDESDSDSDNEVSVVLRPRPAYSHRPLPLLIGSQQWAHKWHCGLVVEGSDSDSDSCDRDARDSDGTDATQSDTDTEEHVIRADTAHVSESSSMQSERDVTTDTRTGAEIVAEIANKLPAPPPIPRDMADVPKMSVVKQQHVTGPLFNEEPPPLDQYESESDEDIFAEINKHEPYNQRHTVQNTLTEDLFGFNTPYNIENKGENRLNDYEKTQNQSHFKQQSFLYNSTEESESFEQHIPNVPIETNNTKKPFGGVSLFGSNRESQSIGAAILNRNKQSTEGSDVTDRQTDDTAHNTHNDVYEHIFNKKENKPKAISSNEKIDAENEKAKNNVIDNLFTDSKSKTKNDGIKDLFSDNLFDDIDDLFTDIKTDRQTDKKTFNEGKKFKETAKPENKKADKLFDSDDELFNDVNIIKNDPANLNVKEVYEIDNERNIKDDPVNAPENKLKAPEKPKNVLKSIFDSDSDSDIFDFDKTSKNNLKQSPSVFDDDEFLTTEITEPISKDFNHKANENINKDSKQNEFNFNTNKIEVSKKSDTIQDSQDIEKSTLSNTTHDSLLNNDDIQNTVRESNQFLCQVKDDLITNAEGLISNRKETPKDLRKEIQATNDDELFNDVNIIKNEPAVAKDVNTEVYKQELQVTKDDEPFNEVNIIKNDPANLKDVTEVYNIDSKRIKVVQQTTLKLEAEGTKSNEIHNIETTKVIEKATLLSKKEGLKSNDNEEGTITNVEEVMKNTTKCMEKSTLFSMAEDSNSNDYKDIGITGKDIQKRTLLLEAEGKISNTEEIINDEEKYIEKSTLNPTKLGTIFTEDLFNTITEPPEFERKEKKSLNVNALFDDDSDDEMMFFKKVDEIIDEKPIVFKTGANFGIFSDEPPELCVSDDDFLDNIENFDEKTGVFEQNLAQKDSKFDEKSNSAQNINVFDENVLKNDNIFDEKDIFNVNSTKTSEFSSDFKDIKVQSDINVESNIGQDLLKSINKTDLTNFDNINTNSDINKNQNSKSSETTEKLDENLTVNDEKTTDQSNTGELNKNKHTDKKIGKINSNININVHALMPGASPKKAKIDENISNNKLEKAKNDENISNNKLEKAKIDENISNKIENDEKISDNITKIDENISDKLENLDFEKPDCNISTEVLNNNISKKRAKIQVKRRPSSRKARHEAVRKSGLDLDNANSSSIDEPRNNENLDFSQNKPKNEFINEKQPSIDKSKINLVENILEKDESMEKFNQNQSSIDKAKDSLPQTPEKDLDENDFKIESIIEKSNQNQSSPDKETKTKIVYVINDEDIFNTKQPQKSLFDDLSDDENLFSKNTFKRDSKQSTFESKQSESKQSTLDSNQSAFDKQSDLDSKQSTFDSKQSTFKSKKADPIKLFDSDSDDELFTKRKIYKNEKNIKKQSLFDDGDLFGDKNLGISKPSTSKDSTSKPATNDPLSLFDD